MIQLFNLSKIQEKIQELKIRRDELLTEQQGIASKIFHPIRSGKNKKDIEALETQINRLQSKLAIREKLNRILPVAALTLAGVVVILIGVGIIKGATAKPQGDNNPNRNSPVVSNVEAKKASNQPTTQSEKKPLISETEDMRESTEVVALNDTEAESATEEESEMSGDAEDTACEERIIESTELADSSIEYVTEEITEQSEEFPGTKITVNELEVYYSSDYNHFSWDTPVLGNGETLVVTVRINSGKISPDDLFVDYDDSLMKVSFEEISDAEIQYRVVPGKTGNQSLTIFTYYDLFTLGEEALGICLDYNKLDADEGRIVYFTSSGEKYHFSESCAGGSSYITTLKDAKAGELEPCKKCAH